MPGFEIPGVATLQLRHRKQIIEINRQIVARLAHQLEPAEPGVALVERETAFGGQGDTLRPPCRDPHRCAFPRRDGLPPRSNARGISAAPPAVSEGATAGRTT